MKNTLQCTQQKYLLLEFLWYIHLFSFFFTPAIQLIVDINNIREGAKGWTHERGTRNMLLPLLYCLPQDIVK